MQQQPKLLERVSQTARLKHLSPKTEKAYISYIRRYILFHDKRHPTEMGEQEIRLFLTHLAVTDKVAASTQNVAFNALLFLYRDVLQQGLPDIAGAVRARQPKHLPEVFTSEEAKAILSHLTKTPHLVASLLYGAGLRLAEAVRLRVKDIDFAMTKITVRDGKGEKDRTTMLPIATVEELHRHLAKVKILHEEDCARGYGEVRLPYALERKYPNLNKSWGWQYAFPSETLAMDVEAGKWRRFHISPSTIQKAVKHALEGAHIIKHGGCHTFRHSFATQLLMNHYDIRTVQELLGHKDVRTPMIYTHVMNRGGNGVRSPLDV
jgi:integron integrase